MRDDDAGCDPERAEHLFGAFQPLHSARSPVTTAWWATDDGRGAARAAGRPRRRQRPCRTESTCTARTCGSARPDHTREQPVEPEPGEEGLTDHPICGMWVNMTLLTAAMSKPEHRVFLADGVLAASAIRRGAVLVHKDPESDALTGLLPMEAPPYGPCVEDFSNRHSAPRSAGRPDLLRAVRCPAQRLTAFSQSSRPTMRSKIRVA
jgi:hypothetical protein